MNKILVSLIATGTLSGILAHDFWLDGSNEDKFKVQMGFGHEFPKPDPIPDERMKVFEVPYVLKKDGSKIVLKKTGENHKFEGEKLDNGSYVLAGSYMPTFVSIDQDNKRHFNATREQVKDAKLCQKVELTSKEIINVGGVKDEFITKPIGQRIEIVPLENPSEFTVGKAFKVKVLLDGKPLKRAKITGTFDEFIKNGYAFYSTTNLEGVVEVMALKEGKWMLKVTHEEPYKDIKVCDKEKLAATLIFDVKK